MTSCTALRVEAVTYINGTRKIILKKCCARIDTQVKPFYIVQEWNQLSESSQVVPAEATQARGLVRLTQAFEGECEHLKRSRNMTPSFQLGALDERVREQVYEGRYLPYCLIIHENRSLTGTRRNDRHMELALLRENYD